MMPPTVSVIIPTYNRKDLVIQAIDSVLHQTFTDYEIIVVDDGSTDGTNEILTGNYGSRICYEWQENQGQSAAQNRGLELARGKYIAWLDSDDVWLPEKLANQTPVLETNPEIGMVCSPAWLIDDKGDRLDRPPLGHDTTSKDLTLEGLCTENKIVASSTVIRTSALKQVGGWDPDIVFGQDWDLWMCMRINWQFAFIPDPLIFYRWHTQSINQFPNAYKAERELSDRIRLLEKAFAAAPDHFSDEIKDKSMARQYGLAAFIQYAIGEGEMGCQYLSQAGQLYPDDWTNIEYLANELVSIALRTVAAEKYTSAENGVRCIEEALASWPPSISLPKNWKHQVLSKFYAGLGFKSFKLGKQRLARSCLLRASALDKSWLKNIGVLSIIGETTFGQGTTRLLRKLASNL